MLANPHAPPIAVFAYHQVGMSPPRNVRPDCFCETGRFRAQMAYLREAGYAVISLREAYSALYEASPLIRRAAVLTFDDGYTDFADIAHPILQEFGYPSVVFAVSGLLGRQAPWLSSGGPCLMSAETLRELSLTKVEIGSHTASHPFLSQLAASQAKLEIDGSKARLEDILGRTVDFFAYPYGDHNAAVQDIVMASGYKAAFTCRRGYANAAQNPFEIPRDEL